MAAPADSDPFEGLRLDDAFVASARLIEPTTQQRLRGRRVRRIRSWAGVAVQTALVIGTALVLTVWSLTGLGSRGAGHGGTAARPSRASTGATVSGSADLLPVPEPWNDPVTELDVQVVPDWMAIEPPSGH
jgi:hypothetical protein